MASDHTKNKDIIDEQNSLEAEVSSKFEELLDDVDLKHQDKKKWRSYDPSTKDAILLQYKEASEKQYDAEHAPKAYHDYLENVLSTPSVDDADLVECLNLLAIALRSYTLTWVYEFGFQGLQLIVSVLDLASLRDAEEVEIACLKCIRMFVRNDKGLQEFLDFENAHKVVANCLNIKKEPVMIKAVRVLIILSQFSPKKALLALSETTNEKTKQLLPIVEGITMTNNAKLWALCLQFINCILTQIENSELQIKLYDEVVLSGIINKKDELECQERFEIKELFEKFKNIVQK